MSFDLGSILSQYTGGNAASGQDAHEHFGQVAQAAPELVRDGLSAMFRSDATPSVGQMASQTYQQSSPTQQAGMLNQILSGLSPAAIAAILGSLNGGAGASASTQTSAQGGSFGGMLGSVLGSLAGGGQGGGLGGLAASSTISAWARQAALAYRGCLLPSRPTRLRR